MNTGSSPEDGSFEAIDWESVDADADRVQWNVWAFVVAVGLLAASYVYERFTPGPFPFEATLSGLDWLTAVSLLALVTFVVVPLAQNRRSTLRYWRRFRTDRLGVASLLYVAAFFGVGLVGPLFVSRPTPDILYGYQPPVGTSVGVQYVSSCVGTVTNGGCHGTWQYPLGTTYIGKDLVPYLVFGTRTTLQVVLVSSILLVPAGVTVGFVAAYAGGRIDAVLMRFAEILQTIPAILVYLVLRPWVADSRLLLMVAVFGLASWGGLARLVRNEARKCREELYVRAAKSAGADRRAIARHHLLPNISGSVLTNVTLQLPMLVLTEAALSFLGLGAPDVYSWGQTIAFGIHDLGLYPAWWVTVFPAVLLTVTVLAFNALGDTLEATLDPRNGL